MMNQALLRKSHCGEVLIYSKRSDLLSVALGFNSTLLIQN